MAKRKPVEVKSIALKVVFILIAIFVVALLAIPNLPTSETTSQGMLDFIQWFVDLRDHFSANIPLYAFMLAALGLGYYFLAYKPKAK